MDQPSNGNNPGYFSGLLARQQVELTGATEAALKKLSDADNGDVKAIAASQIELLSRFYDLSLSQASRSFRWALVASVVGLLFFLAAIAFLLGQQSSELATITMIGGALIEFIAGVNFFLYGKTLSQLTLFQGRLEVTQRFLLANSLCESLGEDWKDRSRAGLIAQLSGGPLSIEDMEMADAEASSRRRDRRTRTDEAHGDTPENPAAANAG